MSTPAATAASAYAAVGSSFPPGLVPPVIARIILPKMDLARSVNFFFFVCTKATLDGLVGRDAMFNGSSTSLMYVTPRDSFSFGVKTATSATSWKDRSMDPTKATKARMRSIKRRIL